MASFTTLVRSCLALSVFCFGFTRACHLPLLLYYTCTLVFLSCFSFFAGDIAKRPASGLRSQSGAKIPPQIRAAAVPTRERLRNKKQRPKREKERERESRARSSFTLFPSTSFVLFANFPGDEWFATPLKRLPPTMRPPKQKNIFARRVTQSFFGPREKKRRKERSLRV